MKMNYNYFIRCLSKQGPIKVTVPFYYDIAIPDCDQASVIVDTKFTILPENLGPLVDYFEEQLFSTNIDEHGNVEINENNDYRHQLAKLLIKTLDGAESNYEVADLLDQTGTIIEPVED